MLAAKVMSIAGVAAIALALGTMPYSPAAAQPQPKQPTPPAPTPGPKRPGEGPDVARCRADLDEIRKQMQEIGSLEARLDQAQKALTNAPQQEKGNHIITVLNELSDGGVVIRKKYAKIQTTIQGHMASHIRDAKSFQDLQNDLGECVVARYVERIAKEEDTAAQPPAPKK